MGAVNARRQRVGVLLALGVLGSTVFLLGGSMPPEDPSAEGLKPPGDCDQKTYAPINLAVDNACKGKNQPNRCKSSDSCTDLFNKTLKFDNCFNARFARETKCFRGGDRGHRIEMQNALNGTSTCIELVAAKKCLPEQNPPTCQSTDGKQPWTE